MSSFLQSTGRLAALLLVVTLVACADDAPPAADAPGEQAETATDPNVARMDHDMSDMDHDAMDPDAMDHEDPQAHFIEHLASMCGRAFRGEALLSTSDDFEGEMIMHVRECSDDEVLIPLHIGENRSRTWIISRTADGLRLKHDHRHEDGSDDEQTMYGGDTVDEGGPYRQSFPADAYTREEIPEASTNVWTITIVPGERLRYHLTRHDQPRATFEFDLTDEVPPPPAPWGYEGGR